jgi:hypothetical protein
MASNASSIQPRDAASKVRRCAGVIAENDRLAVGMKEILDCGLQQWQQQKKRKKKMSQNKYF